jgi:hypothetical protein
MEILNNALYSIIKGCDFMGKMKNIKELTNVQTKSCTSHAKPSKEPNDGYFIEKDPNDNFSAEGTVRYGEEQDVDDL